MAMTEDELVAIVDDEFANAIGAEGGEISKERAAAYDYYLSKPLGNEVEDESQVVTSDVSDVVDGVMPSVLRIFTTADNLVSFDAVSAEDEPAAKQESDYVNHVFFKRNPAFMVLYSWFFDALVQKNGIVKAYWDDAEVITTETYTGLTDDEALALLEDPELEPLEREERIESVITPLGAGDMTVHDIRFRRTSTKGQARVVNVPPEEYRISNDSRSLDPSDARMVGHEREVTRSELLSMGFDRDIVEDLPAYIRAGATEERTARRDKVDDTYSITTDPSQDLIRVREAYIKVDLDQDGKAELRQVFTAGNQLLSQEEVDRQPFHVLCPHPLPHKHFGQATSEKVMDLQELQTTLLRQILMNLYHTNNPGHNIWEAGIGEFTLSDLGTRKIGSFNRFARPVNESVQPDTVPFTAGESFRMVEYLEKVKRDRTGIHADAEGLSPEALKNIQSTVMAQALDVSRMKVEAIARIFAETGIKTLFLHLHELLMKHQQKAEIVKLRNQYVPVNPQEWRTRHNMTVNVGLGIGTREQNLLHLEAISQAQRAMIEEGGMNLTVTPQNRYNMAAELVKNARMHDPTLYFNDPRNQQAPPPTDQQVQLQREQQQLVAKQQELDAREQQLKVAELQRKQEDMQQRHQREMLELRQKSESDRAELARKTEADRDRFSAEMEKIRQAYTELELKFSQNVPGSAV